MRSTCDPVDRMGVMVQIRNVPADLHRTIKARAAAAGMSLSDYLLADLRRAAERPTREEMRLRLEGLPPVSVAVSPEEIVRELRDRG
ncbi:MAG: hypothetical protein JOZ27_03530 [Caulobacteraceae bacterium]|nr:hypothetical protein [Caulobacteraceae bacterium]